MTLTGLHNNNPVCVYGRIKGEYLYTKKYKIKLIHSNYPKYKFGYWLIQQCSNEWMILKVLFD